MADETKPDSKTEQAGAPTEGAGQAPAQPEAPSAAAGRTQGRRRPPTAEEMQRRGGVTEAVAAELEEAGVDPRLDNRVGRQRPPQVVERKPQQVSPDE